MHLHTLKELDSTEGTLQLRDIQSHGEIILHPTPNNNDPNDPLRWSKTKKYICFASVCFFTFLTNYGIGGLAPAFYRISLQFDKTPHQTSDLLLWPVLVLGVSNFFWVPVSNYFGKRPVFVFSTLLLCLSFLWGAVAEDFTSLLWSSIIAAFAGSASEAVAAGLVNDLFFTHERGNLFGWYMIAIAGGNDIGPLICGFIVGSTSWRVHKWVSFGLAALNFLTVLLLCPETRYHRDDAMSQSTTRFRADSDSKASSEGTSDEKNIPQVNESSDGLVQLPKKSFLQDLSLVSGVPQQTSLLKLFLRPLPMIVYPAVILAFLGFAVSLAWVVAINILNSFILQAPPYNWSAGINGLINIPALIGNLFGSWIGGWVVDRYSDWQSRRNNGVFQPETRLHLLWVPAVLVPVGLLAFGYGVERHLHWTSLYVCVTHRKSTRALTFLQILRQWTRQCWPHCRSRNDHDICQ
jgi:MFS family permease